MLITRLKLLRSRFVTPVAGFLVFFGSLAVLMMNPASAFAAPPGCYNFTTGGGFAQTACQTIDQTAAVAATPGACFLSQTFGATTTPLTLTPCTDITLAPAPPPTPPAGGAGTPTGSGSIANLNTDDCNKADLTSNNCAIIKWLLTLVNAMSAIVGVVVVISLIVAGIQYSSAGDDPSKISAAKDRIVKGIIAMGVFLFMFAFLQYIIPGGLF